MASITNLFWGGDEMDITRNLMTFLRYGGYETFMDFLAEGEGADKVDKKTYLDKHSEDEDNIDYEVEVSTPGHGRLDGVVKSNTGTDDFLIIIESKKGGQADKEQLTRYLDYLKSPHPNVTNRLLVSMSGSIDPAKEKVKDDEVIVLYKTWKGLVRYIEEHPPSHELGEAKVFVIEQFKQYLEERGYGMFKFDENVKHTLEHNEMVLKHPFNESLNAQLDNYNLLANEIAAHIEAYYSETRKGKQVPKRDNYNPKSAFKSWNILMLVWYNAASKGGYLMARLNFHLGSKSLLLLQGKGFDANKLKEKPHFKTWEVGGNYLRRFLTQEEVDVLLQEQFDSDVFKTFLEDYSLMLDELVAVQQSSS